MLSIGLDCDFHTPKQDVKEEVSDAALADHGESGELCRHTSRGCYDLDFDSKKRILRRNNGHRWNIN